MPLAPITDHWRAMVVVQAASNMPEDRFVNTFHFRNDNVAGTSNQIADGIRDMLVSFYKDVPTGAASAPNNFLSSAGITSAEIRIYDLGQPEPRAPIIRDVTTDLLTGRSSSNPLPREVAAVISWQTNIVAPKSNVPGKRGRGRTYLGPLAGTAVENHITEGPRLPLNVMDTFAMAATDLLNDPGFSLVVLSPTYGETDLVTKGYVDNAFDTQRRRGGDPTFRVNIPWVAP